MHPHEALLARVEDDLTTAARRGGDVMGCASVAELMAALAGTASDGGADVSHAARIFGLAVRALSSGAKEVGRACAGEARRGKKKPQRGGADEVGSDEEGERGMLDEQVALGMRRAGGIARGVTEASFLAELQALASSAADGAATGGKGRRDPAQELQALQTASAAALPETYLQAELAGIVAAAARRAPRCHIPVAPPALPPSPAPGKSHSTVDAPPAELYTGDTPPWDVVHGALAADELFAFAASDAVMRGGTPASGSAVLDKWAAAVRAGEVVWDALAIREANRAASPSRDTHASAEDGVSLDPGSPPRAAATAEVCDVAQLQGAPPALVMPQDADSDAPPPVLQHCPAPAARARGGSQGDNPEGCMGQQGSVGDEEPRGGQDGADSAPSAAASPSQGDVAAYQQALRDKVKKRTLQRALRVDAKEADPAGGRVHEPAFSVRTPILKQLKAPAKAAQVRLKASPEENCRGDGVRVGGAGETPEPYLKMPYVPYVLSHSADDPLDVPFVYTDGAHDVLRDVPAFREAYAAADVSALQTPGYVPDACMQQQDAPVEEVEVVDDGTGSTALDIGSSQLVHDHDDGPVGHKRKWVDALNVGLARSIQRIVVVNRRFQISKISTILSEVLATDGTAQFADVYRHASGRHDGDDAVAPQVVFAALIQHVHQNNVQGGARPIQLTASGNDVTISTRGTELPRDGPQPASH